jgi:putative hemolysin
MVDFLILLLLLVANGIFAMSEIAVVSARQVRLEPLARRGNRAAQAALRLIEAPTNFLSTVQIGITLIGILAGAISGATLAEKVAPYVARIPWLAPYSETFSLAVMVALVTYLSLVIGELVPKRLALNNPEGIAMRVAEPMRWLSLLALPLVRLLALSTEGLLRLLGVRPADEPPVTEEELKSLLRQGTEAGVFEQAEQQLVRQALDLDDRRVALFSAARGRT